MDWIDRRLAERRQAHERIRIIGDGVDHLWSNLCGAVRESINAYNEHVKPEAFEYSAPLFDAAGEFECSTFEGESMWVQRKPGHALETKPRQKRKVTITRDKAKGAFRATYEAQEESHDVELKLGVNEARQACLIYDRGEISAVIGAELILDRILFPDLPRSDQSPNETPRNASQ